MKKIIKLKINPWVDRENMITALANNGYKVWVEEKDLFPNGTDFYVCLEVSQ